MDITSTLNDIGNGVQLNLFIHLIRIIVYNRLAGAPRERMCSPEKECWLSFLAYSSKENNSISIDRNAYMLLAGCYLATLNIMQFAFRLSKYYYSNQVT